MSDTTELRQLTLALSLPRGHLARAAARLRWPAAIGFALELMPEEV